MIQTYKIQTETLGRSIEQTRLVKVNGLPSNCRNTYRTVARAKPNGRIPFREDPDKYVGAVLRRVNSCQSLRNNRTGKIVRAAQAVDASVQKAFAIAHRARIDERRELRRSKRK